ncbi:MAG: hypothetical protein QXW05_04700 [Ignisphaera sp.]
MGNSLRVLVHTFIVLLAIFLRSKAFLLFIISISLPIAIVTVFSSSIMTLYRQTELILDLYSRQTSVYVDMTYYSNCAVVRVLYADIVYKNKSFSIQIHSVDNLDTYKEIMSIKILKQIRNGYKHFLSIGRSIAELYDIDVDSDITICIEGYCINRTVIALHDGNEYLGYIAITNNIDGYGHTINFCRGYYNYAIQGIVEDLGKSIESIARFLSIFTVAPYLIAMYLAIDRVWNLYRDEISVLYNIGLDRGSIELCFYLAVLSIACVGILYGVSVGVVALHIGLWILKLLGIYMFTVSLPVFSSLAIPIAINLLVVTLSVAIIIRRTGDRS